MDVPWLIVMPLKMFCNDSVYKPLDELDESVRVYGIEFWITSGHYSNYGIQYLSNKFAYAVQFVHCTVCEVAWNSYLNEAQ